MSARSGDEAEFIMVLSVSKHRETSSGIVGRRKDEAWDRAGSSDVIDHPRR